MNNEVNGQPHPEMQIVIEGQRNVIESPRKSMLQNLVSYTLRTIIGLAILAALGYGFLNFTSTGNEFKEKYHKSVADTEQFMDTNTVVIRFLIDFWQRPPASYDEITEFNISRVQNPFTIYKISDDQNLPYFHHVDGFGNKFQYSVDPQKRIITLHSPGLCGWGLLDTATREIPY